MSEEDTSINSKIHKNPAKNPIYAFILSFFIPGLGQVYNGQPKKGILILLGVFIGSLIFLIPGIIVWIFGLYDAFKTSKNIESGSIDYIEPEKKWIICYIVIFFIIIILYILVLSAILASFIFGIAGTQQSQGEKWATPPKINVTVERNSNNDFIVTWLGGSDLTKVQSWIAWRSIKGKQEKLYQSQRAPYIGEQINILNSNQSERIVLMVNMSDGTRQVIFDRIF